MEMAEFPAGFCHLEGYFSQAAQRELLGTVRDIVSRAPLYVPTMPRTGKPFSVRMTNCGPLGWVSSKDGGYRYQSTHPETGEPWPPLPQMVRDLWAEVANYRAQPEACLVNWYGAKTKLGLHVDADEEDTRAPVVSVSLGDDAWFRIGGRKRRDPTQRILLRSGDVIVLGGGARLIHHGIDRIVSGTNELIGDDGRFNLTLRRVHLPDEALASA
jgi:DNA oxidative demethylase